MNKSLNLNWNNTENALMPVPIIFPSGSLFGFNMWLVEFLPVVKEKSKEEAIYSTKVPEQKMRSR